MRYSRWKLPVTGAPGSLALTSDRVELKYWLPQEALPSFRAALERRLPPYHHRPQQAFAVEPKHYTTTVYFDTADYTLYHHALGNEQHVKLRVREYYDIPESSLVDHWSHADGGVARDALFLELKRRWGQRSEKLRVQIPKHRVTYAAARADLTRALVDMHAAPQLRAAHAQLGQVLRWIGTVPAPLQPSAIVNYARAAWQGRDGRLRVTVDEELAVYRPGPHLWSSRPLTRERLGIPLHVHPGAVVEVKYLDARPAWLPRLLRRSAALATNTSKFLMASGAVRQTSLSKPPPR